MAKLAGAGPGTVNSTGPTPPKSRSVSSRYFQSLGVKKSAGCPLKIGPGANLRMASPSAQVVVPDVFPVATKSELPSVATPLGPQMPPPRARVCHAPTEEGFASGIPSTQPWYVTQSPQRPP